MTPEQVKLVQDTFAAVRPIAPQAAAMFYDRLFTIAPDVRSLFPTDLMEQKKKLIAMIGTAVGNLHQLERIVPVVQDLGRRHATYGVRSLHYQSVGEAAELGTAFSSPQNSARPSPTASGMHGWPPTRRLRPS